jgi:hypothetical protein
VVTLPETSPQEFLGLAADYWQAIATFVAPVLAGLVVLFLGVWIGGRRLRRELQGQGARRYFLEEGLDKLSDAYQQMLGATRLNYAICAHLLKVLRDIEQGHPVAPRPDDLPPLVPAITDTTAFAAIGPSSRIADFTELGVLATRAFVGIININLWFLTEIWLPVRGYYSKEDSQQSLNRTEAFDRLTNLAESKYREAEEFRMLPQLLSDLALRTRELGLNSFDDFWRVRKDKEIVRLRNELNALLDRLTVPASPPSAN